MASPSASARTPIRAGTSVNSTGVEATHTPSRQWLSTIFRCSGCLVTRSVAPRPRASGMLRRLGCMPRVLPRGAGASRGSTDWAATLTGGGDPSALAARLGSQEQTRQAC